MVPKKVVAQTLSRSVFLLLSVLQSVLLFVIGELNNCLLVNLLPSLVWVCN